MGNLLKLAVLVVVLQVGLSALALLFHGGGVTTAVSKKKPWARADYQDAAVGFAVLVGLTLVVSVVVRLAGH